MDSFFYYEENKYSCTDRDIDRDIIDSFKIFAKEMRNITEYRGLEEISKRQKGDEIKGQEKLRYSKKAVKKKRRK